MLRVNVFVAMNRGFPPLEGEPLSDEPFPASARNGLFSALDGLTLKKEE